MLTFYEKKASFLQTIKPYITKMNTTQYYYEKNNFIENSDINNHQQ